MNNFTWTDTAVQEFAHVYTGLYNKHYVKEAYKGKRMHQKLEQFKSDYSKVNGIVNVEKAEAQDVEVANTPRSVTVTINL